MPTPVRRLMLILMPVWGRSLQEAEAKYLYCSYFNVNDGFSVWNNSDIATKAGDYHKTGGVPRPQPQAVTEHMMQLGEQMST